MIVVLLKWDRFGISVGLFYDVVLVLQSVLGCIRGYLWRFQAS